MIRIGTSGWQYDHWRGPFYPEKYPAGQMLEFYCRHLDTVEVNNSFYKLPGNNALLNWKNTVPAQFLFAVKASRFITHMKKLSGGRESSEKFFDRILLLGRKLGPVLFQLPPQWTPNPARLDEFLAGLPPRHRYAFEFRDPRWFNEEVNAILRRRRAAFCMYDFDGRQSPFTITARFVYVRLHGPQGRYQGSYGEEALQAWAARFREWSDSGLDIYCYFDNDQSGFAVRDAARLAALTGVRENRPTG